MRLIVIGGGAAGFFCAINAASMAKDLEVVLVEKTNKILSKVKVSGGGRCNLTHSCSSIEEMSRCYPRGSKFLKKTLHQFFVPDTIEWFEKHGVQTKTEADGRMFPVANTSQVVIDCLIKEANRLNIRILLNREVKNVLKENGRWKVFYANDTDQYADFICIASGGFPKANQFGWLENTGHHFVMPVPSLFTFNIPDHPIRSLMGISVPQTRVRIKACKLSEAGPLLITHWGMSGPVILRLSAWGARELFEKGYHFNILVNWLPAWNDQSVRGAILRMRKESGSGLTGARSIFSLPQRLWIFLLESAGIEPELRWAELNSRQTNQLIVMLLFMEFPVNGKTTYKEEFVTAGGIELSEVDHNTMESRLNTHLFFAGEILNVDGITGGYNFQHAWTSAYIAARAIAERAMSSQL